MVTFELCGTLPVWEWDLSEALSPAAEQFWDRFLGQLAEREDNKAGYWVGGSWIAERVFRIVAERAKLNGCGARISEALIEAAAQRQTHLLETVA